MRQAGLGFPLGGLTRCNCNCNCRPGRIAIKIGSAIAGVEKAKSRTGWNQAAFLGPAVDLVRQVSTQIRSWRHSRQPGGYAQIPPFHQVRQALARPPGDQVPGWGPPGYGATAGTHQAPGRGESRDPGGLARRARNAASRGMRQDVPGPHNDRSTDGATGKATRQPPGSLGCGFPTPSLSPSDALLGNNTKDP